MLFAAIITTAVFRFNSFGALAALSKFPTQYESSGDFTVDITAGDFTLPLKEDGRNYSDDAIVITWMWVLMIVVCCSNCCVMGYSYKPPMADPEAAAQTYD